MRRRSWSLSIGLLVGTISMVAAESPKERLSRWKAVEMPLHTQGLSARERQLVEKLVQACQLMNSIYWEQGDPAGLELYRASKDAAVRTLFQIMGSRWDLLDENRPFITSEIMPPGRNLYPKDLSRADVEAYVREHPDQKNGIYGEFTVVRKVNGKLVAIPYHEQFGKWLEPMARALREGADLSDDPAFSHFLRLRADALLSDDYYASDLAWLDLKDPKFDVIFAPYETYLDNLLGVKTSYGASVLIRNEEESRKLAVYQKFVPEIQDALPLDAADRPSKKGHLTPMEVMDAPYRAGDLRYGYQAVADNLPNDPRIHEAKGTKKIFFKNFMDARVEVVILPLAKRLMAPGQAAKASGDGYLASTLLHEISHGLGPAFARSNGKQVDIREAIGPAYSGLEEAKADVVGMFGLKWLIDHDALAKQKLEEYYASYVAGIFRTLRFGTGEAHGRAEMMEFNFLLEQRVLSRSGSGLYAIDYAKMPAAIEKLAKQLLEFEARGDRQGTERWFAKYDRMPAELATTLTSTRAVPVDIYPLYSFGEFRQ